MENFKEKDDGKHIDTVFDLATVKEIEAARDAGNYSTTSAWMRATVEFVLKLRKRANPEGFIALLDEEGKVQWQVPIEVYNFLANNSLDQA